MQKVYSLVEASEFFRTHKTENCICVRGNGQERECKSYSEAKYWFTYVGG